MSVKQGIAFILIAALVITPNFAFAVDIIGADISAFSSASVITGSVVTGSVFANSDITVLHYFSTFCNNIVTELKYMQRAYSEYPGSVNILGLLYEDSLSTADSAAKLFKQYGIGYDCVHIDTVLKPVVNSYNYIPQTFIVSKEGVVIEHFPGALPNYEALKKMILNWTQNPSAAFDVAFIDGLTDEIIEVQQIPYGANAVLPQPPAHEGYAFSYWKGKYTEITAPAEITAVYEPLPTPEPTPAPSSEPSPAPSSLPRVPGDADGDGKVTINDAMLVLRYALGLIEDDIIPLCCDIDGDGDVDMDDVIFVLRSALGLI